MRPAIRIAMLLLFLASPLAAQDEDYKDLIKDRLGKLNPTVRRRFVDETGDKVQVEFNSFHLMQLLNADKLPANGGEPLPFPGIDLDRQKTLEKLVPLLEGIVADETIKVRSNLLTRIQNDTHEVIQGLPNTQLSKDAWENFRDKAVAPLIGIMVLTKAEAGNLSQEQQVAEAKQLITEVVLKGMAGEIARIKGFTPESVETPTTTVRRRTTTRTMPTGLYRYSKTYIKRQYKLRKLERRLLLKRLK